MNLCANETYEKSRPITPDPPLPTVRDSLEELRELLTKMEFLSGRIAEVVGVEPGDPTGDQQTSSIAETLMNDCTIAARSVRRLSDTCALLGIQL